MMVQRLRAVIAMLEHLPAEQHEQAAAKLETWMKDEQRDRWRKSEEGTQFLDELVVSYRQEQQEGTIREAGWF